MPKEQKEDLPKRVMEQIHEGRAKMRPHIYFILGSAILAAGIGATLLASGFFTNLAFFRLRTHAPFNYLQFGQFGFKPFLITFPWFHLIIAILGFVAIILLLRHLDISYKKWFLALVAGVFVLVLGGGLLLSFARFNERIEERIGGPIPIRPAPFSPRERFAGEDWVVGEITKVEGQRLTISTPSGKEVAVSWDEDTHLPSGSDFGVGEKILAVGAWEDESTFSAQGIAKGGPYLRIMRGSSPEVGYGRGERMWR